MDYHYAKTRGVTVMFLPNLKELRKTKGVSQSKCAKDTDIPLRTLQRYESGESIGDTEYLCRLMRYFNLTAEDFVNDYGRNNIRK